MYKHNKNEPEIFMSQVHFYYKIVCLFSYNIRVKITEIDFR